MKISWYAPLVGALVACGLEEHAGRPEPGGSEQRSLASFDRSEFDIVAVSELDDSREVVDADGNRTTLAELAELEWLVVPKGSSLLDPPLDGPSGNTSEDPALDDVGLASNPEDVEELCKCRYEDFYKIPDGTETVWFCSGTWGTLCWWSEMPVFRYVECYNSCSACGPYACNDLDTGASVSKPAAQYFDHRSWEPCNAFNTCG